MSAHWECTRPLPYLKLTYEDAVADPEHHARVLIDYIGLEWDPACLEFNSNPARSARRAMRKSASRSIRARPAGGETTSPTSGRSSRRLSDTESSSRKTIDGPVTRRVATDHLLKIEFICRRDPLHSI